MIIYSDPQCTRFNSTQSLFCALWIPPLALYKCIYSQTPLLLFIYYWYCNSVLIYAYVEALFSLSFYKKIAYVG